MAPTKSTRAASKLQSAATGMNMATLIPVGRRGKRTNNLQNIPEKTEIQQTRGKRKADSPGKNENVKRSALGNLTNNASVKAATNTLHPLEEEPNKHSILKKKDNLQVLRESQNINSGLEAKSQVAVPNKILTRATARNAGITTTLLDEQKSVAPPTVAHKKASKDDIGECSVPAARPGNFPKLPDAPIAAHIALAAKSSNKPVRRISNEFNKTEESLYMSALEDVSSSESLRLSGNFEAAKRRSALLQQQKQNQQEEKSKTGAKDKEKVEASTENEKATNLSEFAKGPVPLGVEDFDRLTWNDPFQVSEYAMEIFEYLKSREQEFRIDDYMGRQIHLTKWMRSLLVDWMVEVQETFELNHETLYLAVKIVDLYLCRVVIQKDRLQLLGAAALFIACKFDERTPPLIEDFLYICDGAYEHEELVYMEMHTFKTIKFDLGIPLSYRFLRRYARCAKVPMSTLTLARYILELSLMDYETIALSDSKLACAGLFMALRLHGLVKPWSATLEYYSGYKLIEFADIVPILNAGLHRKPKGTIKTIRSKYAHKIFHEVAKVPLMTTEQLFHKNLDLNVSGYVKGCGDDNSTNI